MSQTVTLKNSGLQTYPNQLSYSSGYVSQTSTPAGSLAIADDVVINRDNVIEPRRGFHIYGNAMGNSATADYAHQLLTYKDRLFRHFGVGPGTTMEFDDGDANFTAFTASISEVVQGIRIKYAESNSNLYFTSSTGIRKISVNNAADLSANGVVPAGQAQALDITLSLNSAPGFFNQESAVAYRVVWGIKDANTNLILGTPSNRQIIDNPVTPLTSSDFNALLAVLDTINQSNGIHYGNYVASFGVTNPTDATSLRNNMIAMATQIDTDIESFTIASTVVDATGTTSGSTITVTSATGIIIGQQPSVDPTKTSAGPFDGTTTTTNNQITSMSSTVGVKVGQLATCTASGILQDGTTVTGISGSTVSISSLPLVAGSFTSEFIFTNPNPFVAGTFVTAISGTTITLNNATTYSGTYTGAINFNSLFAQLAPVTVIGPNTPSASTPDTDTSTTGTSFNVSSVLTADPSAILQIGDPVEVSGISPDGFNTTTGIIQSITGNVVVYNIQSDPGVYVSGTGTLKRYKYEYLTQPLALSPDPLTNELLSIQTYYSSILKILQTEPTEIVGTGTNPFLNSSVTETATVNVSFPIPAGITTANFFQIYRTEQFAAATGQSLDQVDPGDEEFLAYEANPTPTDLTNGYITVQDIQPDAFLGASLYTNAQSGTGITSANYPPPLAQDLTLYYNYMFYANTTFFHTLSTTLLGVANMVSGTSTLTITQGATSNTYTFSTAAENPAAKIIHISTLPTPAQQIDETARSIVNVINRNASEVIYAFYQSGATDVPGKIQFQARTLGTTAFTLTVDSDATGTEFNPAIPVTGSSVNNTSDNDVRPNRLFYSTQFQPDAVPIVNFIDIGPQDKKILRILGLRQSLFIFKEEGIYRLTGNISQSFVVALFDSSTFVNSPDSAAILNNTIYCMSNQGVVNVSDNGVSILSRPIEGSLIKLNNSLYPNFSASTFGVGYESDRTYNIWTVTNTTDTKATQEFRYNTVTQAWTRCTKTATCGVINPNDDKLYVGATDTNFIEQERKNFDRTDYADRQYDLTIGANAIAGFTIAISSVTNIDIGDVIQQVQYLTNAQFNRLLTKLDKDPGIKTDYTPLTVSAGFDLRNSVSLLATQLDSDPGTQTKTYASSISEFSTSFMDTQSAFNTIIGLLNSDTGLSFKNYQTSTGTTSYEINITDVNAKTNVITTQYAYPFIQGAVITYNSINSLVQWLPSTMGDPSVSKQVSECTCIFEKISFTKASLLFSTDLNPGFTEQVFPESGNGSFGAGVFGETTYGDSGNSIPLRTYIPQQLQRCRYMNVQFNHMVARESFAIFGASLTYNQMSQRAWR